MNLNNIRNLKEFKALIERYESITLEEIEKTITEIKSDPLWEQDYMLRTIDTACKLTGYGSIITCTLCIAVNNNCNACVWGAEVGCNNRNAEKTYSDIAIAGPSAKLLAAFKARATFMREYLRELGINE